MRNAFRPKRFPGDEIPAEILEAAETEKISVNLPSHTPPFVHVRMGSRVLYHIVSPQAWAQAFGFADRAPDALRGWPTGGDRPGHDTRPSTASRKQRSAASLWLR